jgi:hypothetical protein
VALLEAAGYGHLDRRRQRALTNLALVPVRPVPPAFVVHSFPFERIDLIFSQGLDVNSVEHMLAPGPAANHLPYFASDHAGVLAVFEF